MYNTTGLPKSKAFKNLVRIYVIACVHAICSQYFLEGDHLYKYLQKNALRICNLRKWIFL